MNTVKHNKNIVDQFTKQANGYSAITSHSDALGKLIQMTAATKEDKVLDIACGSGIVACEFAKHCHHVTGIDMTQEMLNAAHKLQVKNNLTNVSWEIGDVMQLPYEDNSFSIVTSRFGFHHFLKPDQVLAEMKRVCKPNGIVMVVDVALDESKVKKYNEMEKNRDCSHVAALSITAFTELFENAGLNQIETDSYGMQIELEEQLAASFPEDATALKNMILEDVGIDNLGINAKEINGKVFLNYPISIFLGKK